MLSSNEKIYTLKEISSLLGISYNHLVNNIVKGGLLETVNIGKGGKPQHRVTQSALNDYLSKQSSGEQNTIKSAVAELQDIRGSIVISYLTTADNPIAPDDALFFVDVLEDIKQRKGISGKIPCIDLFVNSFGGSLDTAYKISRLLWQFADNVRAIVPLNAKSAATALCLGTREITMSPISELGPVDPIIEHPITKDKIPARSIKVFLNYASDRQRLEADKIDPNIIQHLGDKLEPTLVGTYFNAINASKEYLSILLKEFMFSDQNQDSKVESIVENLTEQHYSHSFVIDFNQAQSIGIKTRLSTQNELEAIKRLLAYYNQFMVAQNLTKLVGNEFYQIHQTPITQHETVG